jgi:Ca2+/Na+ antiporter
MINPMVSTNEVNAEVKSINRSVIIYAVCTALLPFVIISYQYQRNIQYLSLWQVLLVCVVAAMVLLIMYYISRFFIQSEFGAFLFVGILFASFFTYHSTLGFFQTIQLGILTSIFRYFVLFAVATAMAYRITGIERLKENRLVCNGFKGIPHLVIMLIAPLYFTLWLFISGFFHFLPIHPNGQLHFYCALLIASILGFVCRKYKEKLEVQWLSVIALIIPPVMLIQSIIPIIVFSSRQQTDDAFYKQDFTVNVVLGEQPNVYWIHADGMLGFDSMYRFFGEEQKEFAQELESRGFWINHTAYFDGGASTQHALPTLMSPFYFDRVQSWRFDPSYAEALPLNADLLQNPQLQFNVNEFANRIALQRNETIMAFQTAGYKTGTISNVVGISFYPMVDLYYDFGNRLTSRMSIEDTFKYVRNVGAFGNLVELVALIAPTPHRRHADVNAFIRALINNGFESTAIEQRINLFSDFDIDKAAMEALEIYNQRANSLLDIFEHNTPRFVVLNFFMPHRPFYFDEYGNFYSGEDENNPMRYPAHHEFSARTLLSYIDLILEHDPDAVIVVQADHGLHDINKMGGIDFIIELFSSNEDEIPALWNQVMSAVRLPDEKMTDEAIEILSDPRNISRFLINNFVGENYEYIPPEFRQGRSGS